MSVDLPSILHLSGLLHLCLGFNKSSHHFKVLKHPNEEQSVIEIDVNGDARLISKAYEVITKKRMAFVSHVIWQKNVSVNARPSSKTLGLLRIQS